jgi:EAL domain-containing protein (putative c-di-GMP-specific phosphodiesterase class I)
MAVESLADGRLELHVQPISTLGTGGYVGLESLVQLPEPGPGASEPEAGILAAAPDETADDPADVIALNTWLVREAAAALAHWQPGGRVDGVRFVSIPVHERFVADDSFLATVKEAVRSAGIGADNLLLTVDARPGFDRLWSRLQRLKSHGVRVALDEFSSDSHASDLLRRFAFDFVRIATPASLVQADDDSHDLRTTIKLAHHLGCEVIMNGVDDDRQIDLLRWLGADLAFGASLGMPRPGAEGPAAFEHPMAAQRPTG